MNEIVRAPKTTGHLEALERIAGTKDGAPPVARLIGFDLEAIELGRSVFSFQAEERHANPMGTLHGGVICAVADAAMGTAIATTLEDDESFTTLSLTAEYFKPVWTQRLRATARVTKRTAGRLHRVRRGRREGECRRKGPEHVHGVARRGGEGTMKAYIIDAVRTPRGRGKAGKGALSGVHPQELLATALRALPSRTGFDARDVEDLIVGCVSQVGEQGANIARNAVLAAGWPIEVSATTVNRFCGSGLQAANFAAMAVASGAMQLAVAGGVESMSRVPMASDGGGVDGGNMGLRKRYFQVPQGISADLIATLERYSREEVDAIALRSQRNAARAVEGRRFDRSLVPVIDPTSGKVLLDRDESPRPDTTADGLARLVPSFVQMGASAVGPNGETLDEIALSAFPQAKEVRHLHTAGNSSGLADGAGAVVIASEETCATAGSSRALAFARSPRSGATPFSC